MTICRSSGCVNQSTGADKVKYTVKTFGIYPFVGDNSHEAGHDKRGNSHGRKNSANLAAFKM